MIENISEVYEDVDIKLWASKIRENKIRDLKSIVESLERELKKRNNTKGALAVAGQVLAAVLTTALSLI